MSQHDPVIPGTTAAALLVVLDVVLILLVVTGAVFGVAALLD